MSFEPGSGDITDELVEEDSDGDESENSESSVHSTDSSSPQPSTERETETSKNSEGQDSENEDDAQFELPESTEELAKSTIPEEEDVPNVSWISLRDSVYSGRTKTTTIHLQPDTLEVEQMALEDCEEKFGTDVTKTDLREAALLVGYTQPDRLQRVLSTWGVSDG